MIPHDARTEADICADVVAAGGFAFAAHPFSEGSRMSRRIAPPHAWGSLEDPACGGVELWSVATDAAEG